MAPRSHLPTLVTFAYLLVMAGTPTSALAQERMTLSDSDDWVASGQIDPGTPEGQLAQIRKLLAEGDPKRAENFANVWLERHRGHPMEPEAYLLRGDSFRDRGDYYESLFDYEFIARSYPGSEVFVKALERELEVATLYAGGLKRKLWGMRIVNADDEAQELMIRVQERLPGSHLAEEAGIKLSDFYFSRKRMSLAVESYELFIENYPRSDHISKARRRLISAHLASFKGPEFDASGLYEARALLHQYQVLEPSAAQRAGADAWLVRIDESDAKKMLTTAQWYLRRRNPVSAEITIRKLILTYPNSVATAEALRLMPNILPRLSPYQLDDAPDYEGLLNGPPDSDDSTSEAGPEGNP
ncbi:MAG: outer membrane protein assembly factor BamD [Planctomycetota bacterium]|nr:outer membrane protein assembly factor BamD [Planctomycetota bacterium]